jgi:two-component system chemotaxis response regulator CheB
MAGSRPRELDEPEHAPVELAQRDIVVLGASAGGVQAFARLARDLPDEFPASVFMVLHLLPTAHSVLPDIVDRAGPLHAAVAQDGEAIERGRIYVAPPDRHLLLTADGVRLSRGPRENGHRPALDPLFRSAARTFGPRVIAVVLSGSLDDGTDGLRVVRRRGGATVAQDPEDALHPSMPASAVANDAADHVVPLADMASLLCDLVEERVEVAHESLADDVDELQQSDLADEDPTSGDLTGLTCPECGGALWEHLDPDGYVRFKCHVGHAYSPDSLETAQSQSLEAAMWSALRALEERRDLYSRLARRAGVHSRSRFEVREQEIADHARLLRESIERLGRGAGADEAAPAVQTGRSA